MPFFASEDLSGPTITLTFYWAWDRGTELEIFSVHPCGNQTINASDNSLSKVRFHFLIESWGDFAEHHVGLLQHRPKRTSSARNPLQNHGLKGQISQLKIPFVAGELILQLITIKVTNRIKTTNDSPRGPLSPFLQCNIHFDETKSESWPVKVLECELP